MKKQCAIISLLFLFTQPSFAENHDDQMGFEEATVEVNGVEIFYRTAGKGEPLLLLHGFSDSGEAAWLSVVQPMLENYEVIIPDLRGHGRSTNPTEVFFYPDSAKDMLGLADHLGIESLKGIGYSAGAITLIHLVALESNRIESMILIAGAARLTKEVRELHRNFPLLEGLSIQELKDFRSIHPGGDEQIQRLMKQRRAFADDYESFEFSPERYGSLTTRSLIIIGDRDTIFPMPVVTEMYESLPNAHLWVIPGADHDYFWPSWESYNGRKAFFSGDWWPPLKRFLTGEEAFRDVTP